MLKFKGEKTEELCINVIDYQFPYIEDSEFDSNWLLVDVNYKSRKANWSGRLPSFLTWELEEFKNWLESIREEVKPNMNSLDFLEPDISVSLIDSSSLGSLIKIEVRDKEFKNGKLEFVSFNTREDIDNHIAYLKEAINKLPKRASYKLESRGDKIPYFVGVVNGVKRWEYRDEYNKTIEGPYDEDYFFMHNVAIITRNDKHGAINSANEIVIPIKYDSLNIYPTCKIKVGLRINGELLYGLYNAIYKRVLPVKFRWINTGHSIDIARKPDDDTHYFYDENGKLKFKMQGLLPFPYSFTEGFCCVYRNGHNENRFCAFINEQGEFICDFKYEVGFRFSEGFTSLVKDGKYGLINEKGVEVLPFEFEYLTNFKNGFALVKLNDKYGLINKDLEIFTDIKYDKIEPYLEGKFMFSVRSQRGYIDAKGKEFLYK